MAVQRDGAAFIMGLQYLQWKYQKEIADAEYAQQKREAEEARGGP